MRLKARGWLFIAVGVALTGVEVYGCVEYLMGRHGGQWSYIVALGAMVTASAALIPLLVEKCWADRNHGLALICALAAIPALTTIFLAAVERTGGARDTVVSAQRQSAVKIAAAERAERAAEKRVEAEEANARASCTWKNVVCANAEERAKAARTDLAEVRRKRVEAGDLPLDPQARRISAMTGLSEATIQLWEPLILPITGSLLGILFLAVGGKIENAPEPETPETKPAPQPRALPQGSIPRFILQRMPVEAGGKAEIEEIYATYVAWCSANGFSPAVKGDFATDFVAACKKAGIGLKSAGKKVYCLDRRLSA
jgi:hypothetical protein